jgi:hypothetical protein
MSFETCAGSSDATVDTFLRDGRAGRCIDVPGLGRRCKRPLNCVNAGDNKWWQLDPLTGFALSDTWIDLENDGNYGDYEAAACTLAGSSTPAAAIGGPAWFEVCYDATLGDHTPVDGFDLPLSASLSHDVAMQWRCDSTLHTINSNNSIPLPLRRPTTLTSGVAQTDDDCTSDSVASNGELSVQIGEIVVVAATLTMPEGSIVNARLGVRLPPGVVFVSGAPSLLTSTIDVGASCAMSWTANGGSSSLAAVERTIDAARYAVFEFGTLRNSAFANCSNGDETTGDNITVNIALRVDNTDTLRANDTFVLSSALIYDVVNPSGVDAPPQGPYPVIAPDHVMLASNDITLRLVLPSLNIEQKSYVGDDAAKLRTSSFRAGDVATLCITISHDAQSAACVHWPAVSTRYGDGASCVSNTTAFVFTPTMLPTSLASCSSLLPTPSDSMPPARLCEGRLDAEGSLTACYTTIVGCPSPPVRFYECCLD